MKLILTKVLAVFMVLGIVPLNAANISPLATELHSHLQAAAQGVDTFVRNPSLDHYTQTRGLLEAAKKTLATLEAQFHRAINTNPSWRGNSLLVNLEADIPRYHQLLDTLEQKVTAALTPFVQPVVAVPKHVHVISAPQPQVILKKITKKKHKKPGNAHAREVKILHQQIKRLNQSLEKVRNSYKAEQAMVRSWKRRYDESQEQLLTLQTRHEQATHVLTTARSRTQTELEQLHTQLQDMEQKYRQEATRANQQEERNRQLQQSLDSLRQQLIQVQPHIEQLQAQHAQALQQQRQRLEQQTQERIKTLELQQDAVTQKAQQEMRGLQAQLAQEQQKARQANEHYARDLKKYQDHAAQILKEEHAQHTKQLEQVEQAHQSLRDKTQEIITRFNQELAQQEEKERLQREKVRRQQEEMNAVQQQLTSINEEIRKLETKERKKRETDRLNNLESQRSALDTQLELLKQGQSPAQAQYEMRRTRTHTRASPQTPTAQRSSQLVMPTEQGMVETFKNTIIGLRELLRSQPQQPQQQSTAAATTTKAQPAPETATPAAPPAQEEPERPLILHLTRGSSTQNKKTGKTQKTANEEDQQPFIRQRPLTSPMTGR